MDGVTTARVAARRPNDDAAAVRASASQPLRAGLASQKERVDKATAELVRKHRANNAATKRAPRTGTQKALDAYLAQARATYTLGGRTVRVLPGFRMVSKGGQIGPTPAAAHRRVREALPKPALARVAPFLGRVVTGKASPEQVRRVTQALIDAGKLPPRGSDRAAIRQLQFDHGIGLDCSGYAFKAFHQMRGTREAQPGHLPSGTRRFDDPKALRPGDLVRLAGSVRRSQGHRVEPHGAGARRPRLFGHRRRHRAVVVLRTGSRARLRSGLVVG